AKADARTGSRQPRSVARRGSRAGVPAARGAGRCGRWSWVGRGSCAKKGADAWTARAPRCGYILRHGDACQTTLNPGFKWGCLEAFGLPAARRTCTPGFRCIPVVVIKGQGVCLRTPLLRAEDADRV